MALFDKEGHLTVKDKQFVVGELIHNLAFISGEYLAKFLQDIGLNVPRKMRMGVLKNVLKESIEKTIEERKTLADEMGYRLTWFSRYTDTQLVNLLEWYESQSLSNKFLEDFWTVLLPYLVEKGVAETELFRLFDFAELQAESGKRASTEEFNKHLNVALYDEEGEIDGVTQDAFRPVLYKSSTLTELRAIGTKFNAPIPKRLKKHEVLEVILKKLDERRKLTKDLEEKLKNQNIILLERYAKDNDIKVSTELKKEEIIEFILSNAKETKATYYIPSSSAVYEKQVEEVQESAPIIPSPIYAPTGTTVMAIDYRPEFDRLAKAFESLAESFAKKEFVVNVTASPVVNVAEQAPAQYIEKADPVQIIERQIPVEMASKNAQLITELLLRDEVDDFPVPVAEKEEVTLPREGVEEINETPTTKVVRKYHMPRWLLILASLFAWLFAAVFLAVGVMAVPEIDQLGLIAPYITFYDITTLDPWLVVGVSGGFFLVNFIAALRFASKKVKRGEVLFWGLITLVTGVILTGLFALIAVLSRGKETEVLDPEDQVGRIVQAINNLGGRIGTTSSKGKKSFISALFGLIGWLIVIVSILFLGLYAIWRLQETYGYENIEFIGPWLRDSVIIPLFGSSHEMA